MPFFTLDKTQPRDVLPGCHARFVHSENMTLSYWNLDADAKLPAHSHPHEQATTLIEGSLALTVDGETRTLTPGMGAIIPSNCVHSAHALTPCYVIDVFYPIREDYR